MIKNYANENLSNVFSNVINQNKNTLNLQKIVNQITKKTNNMSSGANSPIQKNYLRKKSSFNIGNLGAFSMKKTKKTPQKLDKTENFMKDIRERANTGNERIKENVSKDIKLSKNFLKKYSHSLEEKREKKLKYFINK